VAITQTDDQPTPDPGGTFRHFVRIVVSGLVLAGAIGLPSSSAASTLSTSGFGLGALVKASFGALVGAAIAAAIARKLVREVWSGWVGVLGGVVPASLVGSPEQQLAAAGAYALGGAAMVALAVSSLRTAHEAGSVIFSFSGLVLVLVGVGIGVAGAIPRLVFARRRHTPAQPDDAVTRHVWLFLTLVLGALGLSSGIAETLPTALHESEGIPLRTGMWNRGCVSTLDFEDTPCALEQRYLIVADREEERDVELSWELIPGRCEVVVHQLAANGDERRRVFDVDAGWIALHVAPGQDIVASFVGLTSDPCWYRVRVRPPKDRS
jgi:hypothetical protein